MKLATQPVDIEKSADFDSIMMGIGNEVMIMEFLRNNLYSNKIGIVVQEYMSNARDAHREVGTPTRPIEITLPTQLSPEFRVRDFGPGINHDRMEGAFAQYGISTKNQDDEATGGFGIGCMSGFSYTDSFTVIVILPDRELDQFVLDAIEESGIDIDILIEDGWIDSNRTKRHYICYIDETRAGTIDLVDTQPTDEPVGTTIVIPCKKGDAREFRDQVIRVTQWWDVVPNSARPIVKGECDEIEWPRFEQVYTNEEGRWSIQKKLNIYGEDPRDAPYVILDGIPYPLNLASIYPRRDMEQSTSIFDDEEEEVSPIPEHASALFSVPLRMQFNTGELTVAVSREALDYGTRTRQALRERIKTIHSWICEAIDEEIGTVTNLWEACAKWREIKRKFAFIEVAAEWQGHRLFDEMEVPTKKSWGTSAKECTSIYTYYWNGDDFSLDKEPSSNWHNAKIVPDTRYILVEDDTDFTRPPKSKMRTIMQAIPEADRAHARVKVVKFRKATDKIQMDRKYSWTTGLKPTLLSQVEKTLLVRPKSTPPKQVKVRVMKPHQRHFAEPVTKADLKNGSGIYVAQYRGRYICDPENFDNKDYDNVELLTEDQISNFCEKFDVTVYAILERYTRKLGDGWKCFADFIRQRLQEEVQKSEFADLFWMDPSYNADHHRAREMGLGTFWANYQFGKNNEWIANMNDPVLREWLETSARYSKWDSEIAWLRKRFKRWGLPKGEETSLINQAVVLADRYSDALRYLTTCPTTFSYGERNRTKEIVADYYSFFTKHLNLIELEKRLGAKS